MSLQECCWDFGCGKKRIIINELRLVSGVRRVWVRLSSITTEYAIVSKSFSRSSFFSFSYFYFFVVQKFVEIYRPRSPLGMTIAHTALLNTSLIV